MGEHGAAVRPGATSLIEAAQNGDAAAFRSLYEDTAPALTRYLARRAVPVHDAEDLLAETYRRAWESLPRYEDRGLPFIRWLYRILGNLIASQGRRHEPATTPLTDTSSVNAGFEGGVIARMAGAPVWTAVAELPESQRRVLFLRFVEDRSVADCSSILRISDDAVRALTFRALRQLRKTRDRLVPR